MLLARSTHPSTVFRRSRISSSGRKSMTSSAKLRIGSISGSSTSLIVSQASPTLSIIHCDSPPSSLLLIPSNFLTQFQASSEAARIGAVQDQISSAISVIPSHTSPPRSLSQSIAGAPISLQRSLKNSPTGRSSSTTQSHASPAIVPRASPSCPRASKSGSQSSFASASTISGAASTTSRKVSIRSLTLPLVLSLRVSNTLSRTLLSLSFRYSK